MYIHFSFETKNFFIVNELNWSESSKLVINSQIYTQNTESTVNFLNLYANFTVIKLIAKFWHFFHSLAFFSKIWYFYQILRFLKKFEISGLVNFFKFCNSIKICQIFWKDSSFGRNCQIKQETVKIWQMIVLQCSEHIHLVYRLKKFQNNTENSVSTSKFWCWLPNLISYTENWV